MASDMVEIGKEHHEALEFMVREFEDQALHERYTEAFTPKVLALCNKLRSWLRTQAEETSDER